MVAPGRNRIPGQKMTAWLAPLVESAINELFRMDPDALKLAEPLRDKPIGVFVTGIDMTLQIMVTDQGVRVVPGSPDSETDITLRGSPVDFLSAAARGGGKGAIRDGSVEIEGDADTAAALDTLFKNLTIDWEEWISKWFGDGIARQMGNSGRTVTRWVAEAGRSAAWMVGEYLREEKKLTPDQRRIDRFLVGVDQLRNDVDRLEHRLTRLAGDLPGE
jgi:ubiquinone biosynthesis protein UbiJ